VCPRAANWNTWIWGPSRTHSWTEDKNEEKRE
jgi:hypothetical protein